MTDDNTYKSNPKETAKEALKIIGDYEQIYDLAGKRLALVTTSLNAQLEASRENFVLGVVGSPNRGKTTLAYSMHKILNSYGLYSTYSDWDLYSNSGLAMKGLVGWDQRPRGNNVSIVDTVRVIQKTRQKTGLVIADFPGEVWDKYQEVRLKNVDAAMLLYADRSEFLLWKDLVWSNTRLIELKSQTNYQKGYPKDPQTFGLDRSVTYSLATFAVLTKLCRIIASIKKLKIVDYEGFFSKAEMVALEEWLDFEFAPIWPPLDSM